MATSGVPYQVREVVDEGDPVSDDRFQQWIDRGQTVTTTERFIAFVRVLWFSLGVGTALALVAFR